MSTEIFLKGLFAAIFSLTFAWMIYSRYDAEGGKENVLGEQQRYQSYVPGFALPLFLAVIVELYVVSDGWKVAGREVLSFCFGIFLHISFYYVALMAVLLCCAGISAPGPTPCSG